MTNVPLTHSQSYAGRTFLIAAIALTSITVLGMSTWYILPRFAPLFVIDHSPWVEPVLRADIFARERIPGYHRNPLWGRIEDWGGDCIPGLLSCLKSSDARIRQRAADCFEGIIADERAIGPLQAALFDHDAQVRSTAFNALTKQSFQRPKPYDWMEQECKRIVDDTTICLDVRREAEMVLKQIPKLRRQFSYLTDSSDQP
jgi:hypothetical protein